MSFRKRAGYAWTDEDEAYVKEFSDAALDEYRRLGATSVVIPYAKGFGLLATGNELKQERDIIRRAHAKGLRVATYVRIDALVPETVRAEWPNVDQWLTRGSGGQLSAYSQQQTWRKRICYSHPDAVAYLESVLRYAILTLETDQLHLDGYSLTAGPAGACRCTRCLSNYRRWLRYRFATSAEREACFGILDVEQVEFPAFDGGSGLPPIINSPDIRAWFQFQWERELAFTRHVRRFVRSLHPDVAISINPILGVYENASVLHAQRAQALLPWVDLVWCENPFHLRFENGRIVSRVGALKVVREAGLPMCMYHWARTQSRIEASVALSIAANGGHVSCLGFTFRYLPSWRLAASAKTRLSQWVQQHWSLLGNTQPMGDLGLVRHQPSLAWNGHQPWEAVVGLEALLTRMHVPWRLFDRVDHPGLNDVQSLLLAEVESLSDVELHRLKMWVEAGGRLFFTTRTGRYDQERRRRPRHPIFDWVDTWRSVNDRIGPEDWFAWLHEDVMALRELGLDALDDWPRDLPSVATLGNGRLGWWPSIRSREPMLPHRVRPCDLQPPADAEALQQAIESLHGPFTVRVEGPPQLLAEFNRPADGNGRLIHLVRVNDDADAAVDATVHFQDDQPNRGVVCLSPDEKPPQVTCDKATIHLTRLHRYAVLHIPQWTQVAQQH
ncbi:MAG: hypothetical protein WD042_11555 [Phycisphaeraceae bacterium]